MKPKLIQNELVVKKSSIHGYGVFARKNIKKGEIIEECFTISSNESNNDLDEYNFKVDDQYILVMGFGSIYNHSDDPNSLHKYDRETKLMVLRARRFIRKGEEIFISYGKAYFDSREIPIKEISRGRRFLRYCSGLPLRASVACATLYGLVYLTANVLRLLTAK